MEFELFTEKAINVIMLAQEEARRLGHNFVGTGKFLSASSARSQCCSQGPQVHGGKPQGCAGSS